MDAISGLAGFDVPAAVLAKVTEARQLMTRQMAKYSSRNEFMVQLTRDAAYAGLSTSRLADLLGHGITRNSVIGLAHRVKPAILFFGTRHAKPMLRRTIVKRIAQRTGSSSLNPRLSRLVKPPEPDIAAYIAPGAVGSVINRRTIKPRCMWAGCDNSPRATGKPYCEAHDKSVRVAEHAW